MINQGLHDWLTFLTGLQVIEVPFARDRLANNYVTYQINSIVPTERNRKNIYTAPTTGNLYDWTAVRDATMNVSVNIYAVDAEKLFARIAMANDWWEAKQELGHGGKICFVPPFTPRALPALGDEAYRHRNQADLTFYVKITDTRTMYAIQQWNLSGKFVNRDSEGLESLVIDSNINFPSEG